MAKKRKTSLAIFLQHFTDGLYILAQRRTGGAQRLTGLHNAIGHIAFRFLAICSRIVDLFITHFPFYFSIPS